MVIASAVRCKLRREEPYPRVQTHREGASQNSQQATSHPRREALSLWITHDRANVKRRSL